MSSDDSRTTTSSRLSQFGLYRTIDARTEEFLKLSRKRQIRQGCACAAVSTALTVTVVVTVLLVYEYNVNPETKTDYRPIRKPNWFGLVNDSSPFDIKYNKAKLNIDPTTFKLLPIILKALNHNRYLQKFLEDSSTSPTLKNMDTVEVPYERNVFPKVNNNWMRIPSLKTSAVEYKTSPIVYNKSSKKKLNFYMKNRKIRDYQRVMNYFDKMVGDKVVGSSPPTKYYGQYTQPPLKNSTDPINHEETTQQFDIGTEDFQTRTPRKYPPNCRCPKNLGILINKLISSIQELLPEIIVAKSPCKYGEISTSTENPTTTTTKMSKDIINKTLSLVTEKLTSSTESVKKYSANQKWYSVYKTNAFQKVKNNGNTPPFKQYNYENKNADKSNKVKITSNNLDEYEFNGMKKNIQNLQTTTIKAYLEAPELNEHVIPSFTEPMPKLTKLQPIVKVASEDRNKKDTGTKNTFKQESQIVYTIKYDYNDIIPTTDVDIFDLEQIEKFISPGNKAILSTKYEENSNDKDLDLFTLRKMGDLIIPPKRDKSKIETTTKAEKLTTTSQMELKLTTQPNKIHKNITENTTKQESENTTTKTNKIATTETITTEYSLTENSLNTTMNEHTNKTSITDVNATENVLQNNSKLQHRRKAWEDDDNRFILDDDIQDQEILNQVDNIIRTPSKYNNFESYHTDIDTKMLNNEGHKEIVPTFSISMLPQSRPTYLEINRNHDWKQQDNPDYDTVANQNIVFN